jgi:small redox-active disulfide protein 2
MARFIVLGACCKKSADTFANVKQAVKELGLTDEVVNIGDNLEIAQYGVMQTPGLVVDGKVVSYGRLLKVEDVKKIFQKLGVS